MNPHPKPLPTEIPVPSPEPVASKRLQPPGISSQSLRAAEENLKPALTQLNLIQVN